jgi:putative addiction module component (TIGR02574 family)
MIIEQLPNVQELSREQKLQLASELWDEVAPPLQEEQANAIRALVESRMAGWSNDSTQGISLEDFNSRFRQLRHRG